MKKIIGAALGVLVTTTSANADIEITSSRVFNDIFVKNVKPLNLGLQSYGINADFAYGLTNNILSKNVFGWDMSIGAPSSTTEFELSLIHISEPTRPY